MGSPVKTGLPYNAVKGSPVTDSAAELPFVALYRMDD